jgi:hypothetical protein
VELVTKALPIRSVIQSRKQFWGAYWMYGSINFSDLAAAKLIKFTAVEYKPSGTRHWFFLSCLNVKSDVSMPVFIQVVKNDISSVAPYGICRFFDENPYAYNPDDMLHLINPSKSFFMAADSDGMFTLQYFYMKRFQIIIFNFGPGAPCSAEATDLYARIILLFQ